MASSTISARSALSSSSVSAARRSGASAAPALPSRSSALSFSNANASSKRRSLAVRPVAALATDNKPAVVKVANSIGLETKDGIFGFTPFAELWVGRLAMMGFLTSIVEEAATGGKGTLAQIGFETPSPALLTAFLLTFGGLTAASAVRTLADAASGKMSASDALRYGAFLGVKPEDVRAAESAASAMKRADDYGLPGRDLAAIEAARLAASSPADAVLGKEDAAAVASAASQLRASSEAGIVGGTVSGDARAADAAAASLKERAGETVSLSARRDAVETFAGAGEANARYARRVELDNGRWAMVGFAAACAIEAYNGHGILGQLIDWFKFVGLLGEASGF